MSCRECLGLWPYWGRQGLCAHPQYWRRSLRKLPEGRAARWKLKSGQVEARCHNGSAVARILRGGLRRPGPALQWTCNQCKKRRSLCDRHRVRALERGESQGRRTGVDRSVGRSGGVGSVAVAVGGRSHRSQLVSASRSQLQGTQVLWVHIDQGRDRHTSTGTSTDTGTG